jgi:hypothetical protein
MLTVSENKIAFGRLVGGTSGVPTVADTLDYTQLRNKPSIEGVTLENNKTFPQLHLDNITTSQLDAICI